MYVKRFLLSIRKKSVTENFVDWKLPPLFVFSMRFFILGLIKKCIMRLFLGVDPIFFSINNSKTFLANYRAILCLYNKPKNTSHSCLYIWNFSSHVSGWWSWTLEDEFHICVCPCSIPYFHGIDYSYNKVLHNGQELSFLFVVSLQLVDEYKSQVDAHQVHPISTFYELFVQQLHAFNETEKNWHKSLQLLRLNRAVKV